MGFVLRTATFETLFTIAYLEIEILRAGMFETFQRLVVTANLDVLCTDREPAKNAARSGNSQRPKRVSSLAARSL